MEHDGLPPADAILPDEPTCMYCGKICKTTECVWTGDDESYGGWEMWCYCPDCDADTFHKMIKDEEHEQ